MPARKAARKQSLPVRWEELTATDFPKAVKQDTTARRLQEEFFAKAESPNATRRAKRR